MTALIEALEDRDAAALDRVLADEVAFNSPIRTYRDRRDVIHLLAMLGTLFDELRPVREWAGPYGVATFATLRAGHRELDAAFEELQDTDGRVVELTLMMRPLGRLLRAVERMGQALEEAPLPSGASFSTERWPREARPPDHTSTW
jgi:hypothetical protein